MQLLKLVRWTAYSCAAVNPTDVLHLSPQMEQMMDPEFHKAFIKDLPKDTRTRVYGLMGIQVCQPRVSGTVAPARLQRLAADYCEILQRKAKQDSAGMRAKLGRCEVKFGQHNSSSKEVRNTGVYRQLCTAFCGICKYLPACPVLPNFGRYYAYPTEIQKDYGEVHAKYMEEMKELEIRYEKLYSPYYAKVFARPLFAHLGVPWSSLGGTSQHRVTGS